jgi:prepilin-type N-terminal cleavage/methylation domain-containing protein
LGSLKKEVGFTLIELLVVIAIISILAAVAIMQYQKYTERAFDTTAKADLKNAMTTLENYFIDNNDYPADKDELLANGLNLSNDVCFTKYSQGTSVHMHVRHASSSNSWHTRYPEEGGRIQIRNSESCL